MNLQGTPNASRTHIGIFGKVNSGKSTLLNALTAQESSLVSEEKGTTTDPVYKAMEIKGIGPVLFIDTAGYEDASSLGPKRLEKTKQVTSKVDMAIFIFSEEDVKEGIAWIRAMKKHHVKVIAVVNDMENNNASKIFSTLKSELTDDPILIANALKKTGIEEIKSALVKNASDEAADITGDLASENSLVLLVMPQDIQAPKGRLILPQVQTLRELLDKKCLAMSCTTDKIDETLSALSKAPDLIICDSQAFKTVYEKKPKESKITSFSVLFAEYKGDLQSFIEGANAIDRLTKDSRVLIAEACTHSPLSEDIGRIKIPNWLKQKLGVELSITITSGMDFPKDLTQYDLIIHCGACMFNRKYVLSRIEEAKKQNVPITNYGIAIAHLHGILNKLSFCRKK
jgi:[FeFe] hydrogenase H-cluster maturation GTPase HydF